MAKIRSCCYIEVDLSKSYCSISITSKSLILSSVMPCPTRSCVVIEQAVLFMGFLVQLEPFAYSSLKIIDNQKLVYEMYHEENNHHEKSSPSINHACNVIIDGVVKISVQKINGPNELSLQKCLIDMFKHDHDKGVD